MYYFHRKKIPFQPLILEMTIIKKNILYERSPGNKQILSRGFKDNTE